MLKAVKYPVLPQVEWLRPSVHPGVSEKGTHSLGANPSASVHTTLSCQSWSCWRQVVKFEYAELFSSSVYWGLFRIEQYAKQVRGHESLYGPDVGVGDVIWERQLIPGLRRNWVGEKAGLRKECEIINICSHT